MNRFLLKVAAVLGFVTLVIAVSRYTRSSNVQQLAQRQDLQTQEEYSVKRIQVLSGHEFDVTLADGSRIHVVLAIKTVPEAKDRVIKYLNGIRNPRILVLNKTEGSWIIDLMSKTDKEESLTAWLQQQNLSWK